VILTVLALPLLNVALIYVPVFGEPSEPSIDNKRATDGPPP